MEHISSNLLFNSIKVAQLFDASPVDTYEVLIPLKVTNFRRITQAHELANAAADNARTKQGRAYNTKVRGGTIKPGDRVLVKIVAFKERKYKLADRWEHDAYHVISQPNSDTPVFSVKRGNGEGRIRTLHRNLLLPIGFISDTPTPAPRLTRKRPTRAKRSQKQKVSTTRNEFSEDTTSDEK
ncbi:Hypothetical predicted protein [Mytilus galloprovincialis]|uniref:Uncharacterized protein n=1 Tax=Mytilus galloprovincialis TaxID=29158 RepID=A0A8B6HRF8_MYTGA|nr:Hypothetical predicted protein [Mytilus galloprovincialis]